MARRKKDEIRISKEYGLNPTILKCFICGGDAGIALLGDSYKVDGEEAEAPREMTNPNCFCDKCKDMMNKATFILEVKKGSSKENPVRTGRYVAVIKEYAESIFKTKSPVIYMEDNTFSGIFNNEEGGDNE